MKPGPGCHTCLQLSPGPMPGWVMSEEARLDHLNLDQLDADRVAQSMPCQRSDHGSTCRVVPTTQKESVVANCPDCNPDAELPHQREQRIKREAAAKKAKAAAKVVDDKNKLYGPRAESPEVEEQSLPYKDA